MVPIIDKAFDGFFTGIEGIGDTVEQLLHFNAV